MNSSDNIVIDCNRLTVHLIREAIKIINGSTLIEEYFDDLPPISHKHFNPIRIYPNLETIKIPSYINIQNKPQIKGFETDFRYIKNEPVKLILTTKQARLLVHVLYNSYFDINNGYKYWDVAGASFYRPSCLLIEKLTGNDKIYLDMKNFHYVFACDYKVID